MGKMAARLWTTLAGWALLCGPAMAAGGEGGGAIEMVADTRNLSGIRYFIANLYNESLILSGLFCMAGITIVGAGLGLLMDFLMKFTGLDLGKTRKIEH
ncbi:MAG: hypothetical protein N3D11_10995 [Candidatus Sumerlaeia bacterium]|nr:hypothetical protein [Candidatus Sumerlaeia bacterium]